MAKKAKKTKEEKKEEKEAEVVVEEVHPTTESAEDEPAGEDPSVPKEDAPPAPTLSALPKVPKKNASIPKPDEKILASFAGQELEIESNMAKTPNGARFQVPASVAESAKRQAQEELDTAERNKKVREDLEAAAAEAVEVPRTRFDPNVDKEKASQKFTAWTRRNLTKKDISFVDKYFDTLPDSKHRVEAKLSFMELDTTKKHAVSACMVQLERKWTSMHAEHAKPTAD